MTNHAPALQSPPRQFTQIQTPYHCTKAYGPLLDTVYSIRYVSYSAENYIEQCASKKFIDEFDSTPNCTSHLLYFNSKAVGSIRSCVYRPELPFIIPVMEVFQDEIKEHIGLDKTIIEANKFVVHPDFQRKGGLLARFSLYKNIIDSAVENMAYAIVVAVRPAHVKFYKMFQLEPISHPKHYPHLSFPTVLMACTDIAAAQDFINGRMEKKVA